jgi:membrane protein implicated in regulation of membrane protease activity
MTLKELLGVLLFAAGFAVAALDYPLLGMAWYWSAFPLLLAGLLLILRAQRERRRLAARPPQERSLLDALDDACDAWPDRHDVSNAHASDIVDLDSD